MKLVNYEHKIICIRHITSVFLFICHCRRFSCELLCLLAVLASGMPIFSEITGSGSNALLNGLQRPKSETLTWPSLSSKRLLGLISLSWTKITRNYCKTLHSYINRKWSASVYIYTPVYVVVFVNGFYGQHTLSYVKSCLIFSQYVLF